ncbi:MAG: hypothetical protein JWR36_883 [Glaciihabitans sp.]|nr:hypothetical protein [Glaciihabitans sp.]
MPEALSAIVVVGAIAAVMAGLIWLASRARRRGVAGAAIAGALAAYDEAFHATAHDTYVEVQAEGERQIPLESRDNG